MNRISQARLLRSIIERAVQSLDDTTALEASNLHPKWEANISYEAKTRVCYNDVLYTVLQSHTSQSDWTPDAAPSLYAKVLIPDTDLIPEWEQPDSTNPYMKGDKVKHNSKSWISTIDNNVWEPGVYGWEEVDTSESF